MEETHAMAAEEKYTGACHCGAVQFELLEKPERLVACNCSICRRLGALWAHAAVDQIRIVRGQGKTRGYSHGDRTLAFHSCEVCGCTTHWLPTEMEADSDMAVNFRMCTEAEVDQIPIWRFDGADSWEFFDPQPS